MASPVVSVIIPNYNHSRYLRQRIESVLNQTYRDFELIILDDYSTDNSVAVIEEYSSSDKVSHIVLNNKNSGSTFHQWKKGFSLAQGKYIWIAESDDYADPVLLEKLVSLLDSDDKSMVAFCGSYSVDEDGNILDEDWDRNKEERYAVNRFEGKAFVKGRMLFNNSIYNAGMAVFRKLVLDNIDKRYSDYRYCGDWFFWSEACLQGNVIRYCDKLNYFRQHQEKATPKAKSEGLIFIEGKYVIEDLINKLNLSSLQSIVVKGRFIKRVYSSKDFATSQVKDFVLRDVKQYLKYGRMSIFVYGFDKLFNISGLNIRKNRRL